LTGIFLIFFQAWGVEQAIISLKEEAVKGFLEFDIGLYPSYHLQLVRRLGQAYMRGKQDD
jgi:hypothetical protein